MKGSYTGRHGLWAGATLVQGHEFHYSRVECDPDARFAIRLEQGKGIHDGKDGLAEKNSIGSYTHAYFTDAFCRRFVVAAEDFRRNG